MLNITEESIYHLYIMMCETYLSELCINIHVLAHEYSTLRIYKYLLRLYLISRFKSARFCLIVIIYIRKFIEKLTFRRHTMLNKEHAARTN